MSHPVFLLLMAAMVAGKGADQPTVADLETGVLSARRAIQRGRVAFDTCPLPGHAPNSNKLQSAVIWFDHRSDQARRDTVNTVEGSRVRHIEGRNCERSGYSIDYWEKHIENGSIALELKRVPPRSEAPPSGIFDPRLLGLSPVSSWSLWSHHLQAVLMRPDRTPPQLRAVRWHGIRCWAISFRSFAGVKFDVWVVPSQGYSVVRSFSESQQGGKPYRQIVETEVAPVGNTGLWFPRQCTYTCTAGDKLIDSELLRVTDITLNQALPPKVFKLAGMDIAPGTVIAGETPNGKPQALDWTGTKMVPHVNPAIPFRPLEHSKRGWVIGMAVACVLVASVSLTLYWRRSRAGTTSE